MPESPPGRAKTPADLDHELPEVDWTVMPPGTRRDVVVAPSGALARITLGPLGGRRVLLVPGATGSKEDFLLMMPLLAAAGYRVEAFDLAGQYESADAGPEHLDPPAQTYTLELFVEDLLAVLDQGSTPAHVLGYSFAGLVAAAAAIRRPEVVASLTMLSAPPVPGRSFGRFKRVGPVAARADPALAAAVMLRGVKWNATRVGPRRQEFVRHRLQFTRVDSVRDIMAVMLDVPDLQESLRALDVPTLVATGTGDLWPVELHRAFADAIGARFATYATGHGPTETTPHQLVADLLRLFAAASPPVAPGAPEIV